MNSLINFSDRPISTNKTKKQKILVSFLSSCSLSEIESFLGEIQEPKYVEGAKMIMVSSNTLCVFEKDDNSSLSKNDP